MKCGSVSEKRETVVTFGQENQCYGDDIGRSEDPYNSTERKRTKTESRSNSGRRSRYGQVVKD